MKTGLLSNDYVLRITYLVLVGWCALLCGCNQSSEPEAPKSKTETAKTDTGTEPEEDFKLPVVELDDPNFELEPDFRLLKFSDLEVFHGKPPGAALTWSQHGQTLVCSGNPRGYAYTRDNYADFTLKCDYKFVPAENQQDEKKLAGSNTGFLIYINGEHKLWPVSLEVQGKHSEMGQIKANGGAAAVTIEDDDAARKSARKPVGQWNSIEIISTGGAVTAILNGKQVCQSQAGELKAGQLGFQSEDYEVHFRNLRIKGQPQQSEDTDSKPPF